MISTLNAVAQIGHFAEILSRKCPALRISGYGTGCMMSRVPQKRLFLIDTFGFIFRAYHARARSAAPPMRTSTGLSTEAVYIFNNMLRKLAKQHDPEYIASVFESGAPTHRVQEFADYKANRTERPPDLGEQ